MDPQTHFRTLTFNADFGFREYLTPHCECDPKRQILRRTMEDYKHRPRQKKFEVTTKPKLCHFDEVARLTIDNPEPSRYRVESSPIKRHKSASLKKVDLKVEKHTYLDDIAHYESRHKPPGVGKFDLTKFTDLGSKKFSNLKPTKDAQKHNNFDDAIRLAAEVPGPGYFNPHLEVRKQKTDRTDHKFWKQKHASEEKKKAKSITVKLCPNSYTPIVPGTFDSIRADKSRPISRWSHGSIEIRKGTRSEIKEPSPCQYNTVHQWVRTSKKEKPIGHYNLLNRVSSAGSFGVYR